MAALDQINQGGTIYEIVPEIAELFKTTKAYHTGDHVIYEAGWYTFKADKSAGSWDATKVDGPFKVTDQISSIKEDLAKVTHTEVTSTNIAPIEPATTGAIQSNGTVATNGVWGDQRCTPFFPVQPNTKYTFADYDISANSHTNTRKNYLFFDSSKNPISDSYESFSAYSKTVISPANAAYMRVSVQYHSTRYTLPNVVLGESEKDYAPYKETTFWGEGIAFSDTMIEETKSIVRDMGKDTMSVLIIDNNIAVESVKSGKTLKRTYKKKNPYATSNKNFYFDYTYLDGSLIRTGTDDATPLRIGRNDGDGNASMWTIGANHGWPACRVSKGSLTIDDAGSIWSDGSAQYTLMYVDTSYAYFAYPATKTGHVQQFSMVAPVANLSHVSGATHTESVSISGAIQTQLYPSINHLDTKLLINDAEISTDGEYTATLLRVTEHYDVVGYAEAVTYMQNHIGSDYAEVVDNITPILSLDLVYDILPFTEIVYTTVSAIEESTLRTCGFIQANNIIGVNGTVYRYVNGVKDGTVFASSGLVDMTSYSTDNNIISSDAIDVNHPPNRCVEICVDSDDSILYGFTLGYIPDIGFGADSKRKTLTQFFDMRSTKKIYPVCLINKELAQGESVDVVGYRQYAIAPEITNLTVVPVYDRYYVFAVAHDVFNTSVNVAEIGAKAEELDNTDLTHSDFVGANGITLSSQEQYSCAVLCVE